MTDTFGAVQNTNDTFGASSPSTPATMQVSCLDVYSHESKIHDIPVGTTINQFFRDNMNISSDPGGFNIRVNRRYASSGQALNPGDQVLITPTKIQGGV
tara:strand:- start:139 stop:435 length:297 start_codon:yes stop_codon:yes gene_type:complete